MTPDGTRPWAVLGFWLLAVPAAAQLRHSGQLDWRYDDLTVNSGAGRVHAAAWAQAYKLDLDGPLLEPAYGDARAGFSYSDGSSLTQAANTGIPRQQLSAVSFSANLFSPAVRRFVHVAPNFSASDLRQSGAANGAPYLNTVGNTVWGLDAGLSLPRLPAFGYTRQEALMDNPSGISPVRQRSLTENKTVSYSVGHVVANAGQQTQRITSLLDASPPQSTDLRQASLEANYYDLRRARLQSLFLRSDFSQNAANGVIGQRQGSASLGLFTEGFRAGRWTTALNYGANGGRDFLRGVDSFYHNAGLNSTRPVQGGSLANSLAADQTPTSRSFSVSDSLSLDRALWNGLARANLTGSGAYSKSPQLTAVSDGLGLRLDLLPQRPLSYFAEARSADTRAVRGEGGVRVERLGAGANARSGTMVSALRLDRTRSYDHRSGTVSESDQLSLESRGRPRPQFSVNAGYSVGEVGYSGRVNTLSQNLHGGLDWAPWRGLDLSASASWVGTGYTAAASASYSVGKTTFRVAYELRDLQALSAFSHVSVSLTRTL